VYYDLLFGDACWNAPARGHRIRVKLNPKENKKQAGPEQAVPLDKPVRAWVRLQFCITSGVILASLFLHEGLSVAKLNDPIRIFR
jgi:hypothetical protein